MCAMTVKSVSGNLEPEIPESTNNQPMKEYSPGLSKFIFKTSWAIALLLATPAANATLLHRYSFDGAQGAAAITDSVGSANGTLMNGNGSAGLNGSGQLVLDGNQSSAWVSLPSGIMPQLTNATFETWVSQDTAQTFAELWTFGTNNGSAGQGDFLSMIPVDGGVGGSIGLDNHSQIIGAGVMPSDQEVCLTVVYNYAATNASIYLNGVKTGSGAVTIPLYTISDVNNYIGQSQWYGGGIPTLRELWTSFRIYNTAVSPAQIEADYEAGVSVINALPGDVTAIQFNNSTNSYVGATFAPALLAAYSALTNQVDISSLSGIAYTSDNTNVVAYQPDCRFHAVGAGS